ncbi:dihydroxyacetone kinase family protein [Actinoalloteichus fjordicus]|uniref:Homodimeric dihydroxyacetone kinase n=1 Tax=Actinoalloteichus fjordicus TaxID=1612552 RepID=A0AAC9LGR9_9PSEU|nr:dihydroxyacetone kinase family protein [Actinoalloteichus fjordicus]APU16019.1 homodimeric dihydroxyacetone kinase [Actinoalloteichus fjordicus]
MTRLFNDPTDFAEELVDGLVAAHQNRIRRVPGGVVRTDRAAPGTVAVVIGGGSGHHPAFGGLVGAGLAHGAAMGDLFASPSARQIRSVAEAVDAGGGVLLSYGNYAGDVLHFGLAQEQLHAAGIPCRSVAVTDDVASADEARRADRRGIAGDLVVFKAASAAAEAGYDLDAVARVAAHANDRTRSFGVAFTGCTLPGAAEPLFTVPPGRMAVGMGIHGEPGIGEQDVPTADELAELFVTTLLAEIPADVTETGDRRAAVLLNGLGSVKYEELFVVYRRVAALLAEAGVEIIEPEVGELVTSFDMAGVSLTLTWLDDELARFWQAPADAPAYRKGGATQAGGTAPTGPAAGTAVHVTGSAAQAGTTDSAGSAGTTPGEQVGATAAEQAGSSVPATEESRAAAVRVLAALTAVRDAIEDAAEELGRIDAVAGDGDHGIGMTRGARACVDAAEAAVDSGAGAGTTLGRGAEAWADRAGGTSGALWGAALTALGAALGDQSRPDGPAVVTGVTAAETAVRRLGGAEVGDKTMIDVLTPFASALSSQITAGTALPDAWGSAAVVADRAAADTSALLPRRGRARPLAEKSLGTPDAGAVSLALIVRAVHGVLTDR